MLLCGIIDELEKDPNNRLSYCFCQATEARLSNATAVLRGLIYLLVDQQPLLISHVRKKHDYAGKQPFETRNAWEALSKVLAAMLHNLSLNGAILMIDTLDEFALVLTDELSLLTSQLSDLQDRVPLTKFVKMEHFLSQIAHRVLINRIKETVYYSVPGGSYPPSPLEDEFTYQLEQWHHQLPAAIQFEVDSEMPPARFPGTWSSRPGFGPATWLPSGTSAARFSPLASNALQPSPSIWSRPGQMQDDTGGRAGMGTHPAADQNHD
ncbi:hypothetical protein FOMG_17711 [Fusarium oxysporum f. sp. melonis 26406]|uniref:Nephrocystin 3-like N-terminal domain-containing protein n=1 Tax=Fusarium oxysporum f. sp. melonis 26406 TaxID=1089452 RepID=W9Z1H0_FUSOX|nr:hypothetical protein FOMG_17711 [Fusarium oxysporum f. sp. melonis 26406]